ncbi:MAG TPA: transglutaminase-like domain-containing protein [Planctomycetota bacterium]|nr:transglutaminase-like domain-containing protein [Planctomycetota bacterium]
MDLKRYEGHDMFLDDLPEVVRRAWRASIHRTMTFYGEDTVDGQMSHDRFRLCEATADYLYSEHTPLEIGYERGTRPELEKHVETILKGVVGEREKVIAILRFVRDLHWFRPDAATKGVADLFHGGTEEEVIKKGSNMCNEQSRVFCVLCQVAGIPARYVGHSVGGHGVSEARVEGGWAYFDNRGKYFVKDDGTLASAWDLIQDPGLIDRQTPEVQADIREGYDYEGTRRYFSPVEITCVTNYFVWERERYGFAWIWNTPELRERVAEVRKEFPEELSAESVLSMLRGERPWPE